MNSNNRKIKVLMISTDQRIFEAHSAVRTRMAKYGTLFHELHIVVYTGYDAVAEKRTAISENVFAYPTRSKSKLFYVWDGYGIAEKIMKGEGAWVITTQDPFETGILGYLLTWQFSAPLQIQVHTDFLSPNFSAGSLKNRLRVFAGGFSVRKADGLRVVSQRIKDSLIGIYRLPAGKISILPIFVDAKKSQDPKAVFDLKTKYQGHDAFILMASRLTREKNIALAIKAMVDVIRAYPKTLLLIVGDGPEKEHLQSLIRDHKLQNNIVLEPWTNDLHSYLREADIFLNTSNYEGYGMAVVEAMGVGLPVVMTNVGVAGELLIDKVSGFIVPVGDAGAVREKVIELLSNRELRVAMGREARRAASAFMGEAAYLNVYQSSIAALIKKPKLLYVLPRYARADATHFSYNQEFLRAISADFLIYLIIEKGEAPRADLGYFKARVLKTRLLPLRFLETCLLALGARFAGYRDAYVHYSFLGALAASVCGYRVFYWNCGEPWKYERNFFRDYFERLVYKSVDRLVTGTSGLSRQYAGHYGIPIGKIRVVPNWIDPEKFLDFQTKTSSRDLHRVLRISKSAKILLFVHRLSERKGAHYLPDILNGLAQENVVLLIVGDGPERKDIEARIRNYGLSDKARFLGVISNVQLPGYYALSDVFIMPSCEEGFPHVLLEAMAFGVPFVASDVGGVKDIVPEAMYTYMVAPHKTHIFVSKIRELLLKPREGREKLAGILRAHVKKFDLAAAKKAFMDILE